MPPIIMNDCGSGGVSSGSPVIIRGGWVLACAIYENKLPLLALCF